MAAKPLPAVNRFVLLRLPFILIIGVSLLTRVALLIKSRHEFDFSVINVAGVFGIGLFYDVINSCYLVLPFLVYLWLCPEKMFQKKWNENFLKGIFLSLILILLLNAVGEWFFWDEFGTRFNFIAVDYLVYTTEVIGNIRQSYPVELILVLLFLIAGALTYLLRKYITTQGAVNLSFGKRTVWFFAFVGPVLLSFFFLSNRHRHFSDNAFANELAGNGMYELFAAYRNNSLDYEQFYPKMKESSAFKGIQEFFKTVRTTSLNNNISISHVVSHKGQERKLNVVLVSMESFSASFMKSFGNKNNITPFLDSLASQSLLYTNLYATGTRTVRGLEALSLCVPPTPGQSIVRRPNNEGLFSVAQIFNSKGYDSKFIYGGYGYFDNMNYFFESNGYQVVDRSALKDEEIDFENIWGVADENLFTLALREIDASVQNGKHFFAHVMTTSNHRPFTYPEGRIDIPSHTNRAGAVKYTDYAVRKFIIEASKKPWFKNTLFVITSDHCASSAGKTELPVEKYHIPMMIFSPTNITPGVESRLMSQIDIGPTLLGMLNFSYASKFFGKDLNEIPVGEERAFISTYQLLGYLKSDSLVILAPNRKPEIYAVLGGESKKPVHPNKSKLIPEAISWYQSASYSFAHGLMKK